MIYFWEIMLKANRDMILMNTKEMWHWIQGYKQVTEIRLKNGNGGLRQMSFRKY